MADTATLDTTTPDQTATISDQASPVAGSAQTAPAPAAPSGADGIQAGYSAPTDPSIAGQPASGDQQPQGGTGVFEQAGQRVAGTGAMMLHGILSALGGTQDTTYQVQDGKLVASQIPSGPGMQFKRIIAGAVAGLAAGAGERGPGHLGRALAAGTGAGMQQAQQQTAQAKQQAEQDYDQQQKGILRNAQLTQLNVANAEASLRLARQGAQATEDEVGSYNQWNKTIDDAQGKRLGTYKTMDALMAAAQQDPRLHAAVGNGLTVHTVFGKDHEVEGFEAAQVPQAWLDKKIDHNEKFSTYEPPDPDKPADGPRLVQNIAPAGSISNQQLMTLRASANAEGLKYADTKLTRDSAERIAAANNATTLQGDRIRAGAEVQAAGVRANAEIGDADVQAQKESLADGLIDGTVLSKDIKRSKYIDPNQVMALAMQRAKARGVPFSQAIIEQEAKFAGNEKTQALLDGIDRMIGTPTQQGQLDQTLHIARLAGFNHSAPVNAVIQHIKRFQGDAAAKNAETSLVETRRGISTLLGNPLLANSDTQSKLEQADHLLGENPTMENLESGSKVLRDALGTIRNTYVSNNRYLRQRYGNGQPIAGSAPQAASQAPAGAGGQQQQNTPPPSPQTHVFNSAAWAANPANKGKDVNAAIAQAKQQGFTVR